MTTQGPDRLAAPVQPAAAPAPRARHHAVCHGPLPTAEAAFGLQPAAPAIPLASSFCQVQAGDGGNCTIEQQSSSNRYDSSRCTVRSSSARPICPRNRRATAVTVARSPAGDAPAAVARHTGNAAFAAQQSQQELDGGEGAVQPVRPAGKLQWVTTKPPAPPEGGLRRFPALAAPACRSQQQQRHGRLESACATAASCRGAPPPCHSSAPLTPKVAKATACALHAAAPPLPRPLARLRPQRQQALTPARGEPAALAHREAGKHARSRHAPNRHITGAVAT